MIITQPCLSRVDLSCFHSYVHPSFIGPLLDFTCPFRFHDVYKSSRDFSKKKSSVFRSMVWKPEKSCAYNLPPGSFDLDLEPSTLSRLEFLTSSLPEIATLTSHFVEEPLHSNNFSRLRSFSSSLSTTYDTKKKPCRISIRTRISIRLSRAGPRPSRALTTTTTSVTAVAPRP